MKITLLVLIYLIYEVSGHGHLVFPPGRSSMWRYGFDTPVNANDNKLNCGGFHYQQQRGGKCGVCGDPWDRPRENEAGGKYANGVIAATYYSGVIMAEVEITSNQKGWFEFRLCVNNNVYMRATQECLDQNLLELADGSGTRYDLPSSHSGRYTIPLIIPAGVSCSQCVFQWKYNSGNRWGKDSSNNYCYGCGPQEQFYGCADIAIAEDGASITPATLDPTPTPSTTQKTTQFIPIQRCRSAGAWAGSWSMDQWCENNCNHNPPFCPSSHCICD